MTNLNDDMRIFHLLNSMIRIDYKNQKYWCDWKYCLDNEDREQQYLWCYICDQKIMDAWTHDNISGDDFYLILNGHILTHIPPKLIGFI